MGCGIVRAQPLGKARDDERVLLELEFTTNEVLLPEVDRVLEVQKEGGLLESRDFIDMNLTWTS